MGKKPTIGIILDSISNVRQLSMFHRFRADFDFIVYSLSSKAGYPATHHSYFEIRLFESLPDMPGYIRNLDDELKACDLIMGVETSKLSTFQARRIAAKQNKPFAVLVNEFQPYFYSNYPNIRAIQSDILENADMFLPTSTMAERMLLLEGVKNEHVYPIKASVDSARFRPNQKLREKFRKYISVREDEFVILFEDDLETHTRPEELVQALRTLYLENQSSVLKIKMLFVGNGSQEKSTKYASVDAGLGRSVMFLHQDPEPFILDMYAACDVIVSPRKLKTEQHEAFPIKLLEAASCGVVPIVANATIAASVLEDAGKVIYWESPHELAQTWQLFLSNPLYYLAVKNKTLDVMKQRYEGDEASTRLQHELFKLLETKRALKPGKSFIMDLVAQIEALIKGSELGVALVKIEDALLSYSPSAKEKGKLLRLKADIAYYGGEYEKAMNLYHESLTCYEKCHESFRGLGFIAMQNHSNDEAVTFFKKALAIRDDDPQTMLGFGLVYFRLKLFEEAIFWLEKAIVSNETSSASVAALVSACKECNSVPAAIEILERVVETVGEVPSLILTLGQLYIRNGKTEIGTNLLQKALGTQKAERL